MLSILIETPVSFIQTVTPLEANFVVFCATALGTITILWAVIYLLFRPIPRHCSLAPFEHLSRRAFDIGTVFVPAFAAYACSVLLKEYFRIGRPDILHFGLKPLLTLFDYGFPSGHAAFFSALAIALFLVHRRAGLFVGLLAVAVCAARVLAGVHTPLDIVGGFIVGSIIALSVSTLAYRVSGDLV